MRIASLIFVCLVTSCSTAIDQYSHEMRAACGAQNFLRANGYLDELARGPVALELMDGIGYGRDDDSIDWERLAADRRGTFSGRLVGVTQYDGGFSVFYNLDGPRAYVVAPSDLSSFRVTHAPRRNDPDVRISEKTLRCDP